MERPGLTATQREARSNDKTRRPLAVPLFLLLLAVMLCVASAVGCDAETGASTDGETTTSVGGAETESGDIEGTVGEEITVGEATVTVRALHATFQPAVPEQRLSEQSPTAPATGESFYQAYVRVSNNAVTPIRIDAEDFVCAVGDSVVSIEPTRSGPFPRSLLNGTSLDLLLTFKAQAGFQPILMYSPPWYDGVIRVSPESNEETTTTS